MSPKFVVLMLSLMVVSASSESSAVGGYQKIDDLHDPEVVDIAKYAVDEHNKEAKTSLKYVGVFKGDSQVVSGMKYRLVIAATAKDGGADPKNFTAVVWSRAWVKERQLLSFDEAKDQS